MPSPVVTLKAAGLALSDWDALTITRSIDEFADAFSFTCQSRADIRARIKPRGFESAEVWFSGRKVITGTIEKPGADMASAALTLEGRSLPGPMIDSNIRGAVQYGGQTLGSVARRIAEPFGVTIALPQGDSPALGPAVVSGDSDTAAGFLQRLAESMGYLWNSNESGQLQLVRPLTKKTPMAKLIEGQGLFLNCGFSADGTGMYSEYKIVQQMGYPDPAKGLALDTGVPYRPKVQIGNPGDPRQIQQAANQLRGLTLAQAFSIDVELGDWTTNEGEIWEPGEMVEVTAPTVWLARPTLLMIAGVTLTLSGNDGRRATARLVFPGVYSGEMPTVWPWDTVSAFSDRSATGGRTSL